MKTDLILDASNEGKADERDVSKAAELAHLHLCHSDRIYFKPKKLKQAFPKILFGAQNAIYRHCPFFTKHTHSLSEVSFHLYTNTCFSIPETNIENMKISAET